MINKKRALLSATVALTAALAMPGPAMAQYHQGTDPLYEYTYYSDATFSEDVGYSRDTCNWWGVGSTAVRGTWTPHSTSQIWAYCVDGQLQPA